MSEKEYRLYYHSVNEDYIKELYKKIKEKTNIKIRFIDCSNELPLESSRSISPDDVCLICYFASKENIKYTPFATAICDNGLGCGVCISHINLNNYFEQFKVNIDIVINRIISSILWCENYLNVSY